MGKELKDLMAAVRLAVREEMERLGGTQLPTVLTFEQARRELGVSLSTLKTMVREGAIRRCPRGPGGVGIPKTEVLRVASVEIRSANTARKRRSLARPTPQPFNTEAELAKLDSARRKRRA